MNTAKVTDELNHVMQTLYDEGKKPTVALVKARLSSSVPMPKIIRAIKSWKPSNKAADLRSSEANTLNANMLQKNTVETSTPSHEQTEVNKKIQHLEAQVEELKSQTQQLTAQLATLNQRLTQLEN